MDARHSLHSARQSEAYRLDPLEGFNSKRRCYVCLTIKLIGVNMKVGDLVRHWRQPITGDIGIITDTRQNPTEVNHKVIWLGGDGVGIWYGLDKLELVCK